MLSQIISHLTTAVDRMNQSLEAALPSLQSGSESPSSIIVIPEVPVKTATESSEMSIDDPSITPVSLLSTKPKDVGALVSAAASLSLLRPMATTLGGV